MNHWKALLLLPCAMALAACSNSDNNSAESAAAPAAAAIEAEVAAATAVSGRVYIVSPENAAVLTSPVTVAFGIEGYAVAPAGSYEANTGHHHLLIDTGLPSLDQPVPADANHVHFGKGQTETTLELAPGEHTLQLLLGDGNHVPHQPPLASAIITITVSK
jgi:hypothetical protein